MANKYFEMTDKVYDVTTKYPEVIDILAANGLSKITNPIMRRTIGKAVSLKNALLSKGFDLDLMEQQIVEAIESNRHSLSTGLAQAQKIGQGSAKVVGILPCPIRVPLLERLEEWIEQKNSDIDYDLKAASMGVDWLKDDIYKSEDEEQLADVYMSAGFDLFFDGSLMRKFVDRGVFIDISKIDKYNACFEDSGVMLKDPRGQYTVIGVVPAVFGVNIQALGERKMPERWEDLLAPEFASSIALPTKDLDLFNAILLNIRKNYGDEGVRSLGRNLISSMHPAEMVKSDVRRGPGGAPAITVMPYFFTTMMDKNAKFRPVWPQEGAIISPIFMLTKAKTRDNTAGFVDFLFSKEVGEIMSGNGGFPSAHPEVDNKLDKDKGFMWLGWDYIYNNDIGRLIKDAEQLFNQGAKGQ